MQQTSICVCFAAFWRSYDDITYSIPMDNLLIEYTIHQVHCLARNVFLLYVNDLESNVPLYKYVDDGTLFEICNTTDVSVMQESIYRAVNWTNNKCTKINSKKSKEMAICFTPNENVRNSIPSIVIDGNIVETVEYAKLLEVTLSNDLSWNRHADCIVKKSCQNSVYVIS